MRKKLALFAGAVGIIVAGVVAFLAFESYTLDINAHLEPVLAVNPHGDWDLGTVYPEQDRFTKLFVGLSNSAKADPNFIAVQYNLSCQSKRSAPAGAQNLCPHISVDDQASPAIFTCPQPFTDAAGVFHPTPDPCKYITRSMDFFGQPHGYGINIEFPDCEGAHQKEPGAKEIDCGFDPATGKFAGVDLAASISVRVLDIDQDEECITTKDGPELASCTLRHVPGAFQFMGSTSTSAKAQIIEIHFGKTTQRVWIDSVFGFVKSCADIASSTSFSAHEKEFPIGGGPDQTHGDPADQDHEVWRLDFGEECIQDHQRVEIGVNKTDFADFTTMKDIFLLDGSGNVVVGTVILD